MAGDEGEAYVNRKTGELASFVGEILYDTDEIVASASAWEAEIVEHRKRVRGDKDFIVLPSKFDVHEYAIMERFCLAQSDQAMRARLLDAIRGRKAFRRFRDLIRDLDIDEDWYRYRDDALKRIAADFLEENAIPYVDDGSGGRRSTPQR